MTPTRTIQLIQAFFITVSLVMLSCIDQLQWRMLYFFQFLMNMGLVLFFQDFLDKEEAGNDLALTTEEMYSKIALAQEEFSRVGFTVEEVVESYKHLSELYYDSFLSNEIVSTFNNKPEIAPRQIIEGYCIDPTIESQKVLDKEWTVRTEQ